ncbi:MAG: septum formation initiator family protein [Chitinispirillaceae bacterium]|nr:septum formation initiator family protein [Chitinispirillaceae bacterium]
MKMKRAAIGFVIAALAAAAVFFLFGKQGIYYLYRQEQERRLEIKNDRRIIDSLQREIKRLTNDTAYIARIAREKLGMAKPDEKVFKFVEKRK